MLYLMHYSSYFAPLNDLVYHIFLNLFRDVQLQLIFSDISQNIFHQATKDRWELVDIKHFSGPEKELFCSFEM